MSENRDIAVLAKKVYELSVLKPAELDARKWEALLIVNAVYSSATPEGVAKANADKEARWGDKIRAEGFLSGLHPRWHLRTDDGKPPAARHALESALTNPNRDLRARLATLQFVAPTDRPPLDDLARALISDAFNHAKSDARHAYIDTMRSLSPTWFREPWLAILSRGDQLPPVSGLIENQGPTSEGDFFDDPSDDVDLLNWNRAVREWNVEFLRDNPLAQLYTKVEAKAASAAESVGDVADAAKDVVRGMTTILHWAPYVVAGIGAVGLTLLVVSATSRHPADAATGRPA